MILAYYWYFSDQKIRHVYSEVMTKNTVIRNHRPRLWTCRERDYFLGFQPEQIIRRMVEHMPLPTAEQRLLLQ